ncbi:cupin domain-containing protein [Undibacterium sp. Di27W]|uniref:cupin domain-containing protein n=1 Tax=Undibacterium sp. Di27W TaxID=3413036 RepID=UPI003BF15AD8
MRSQHQSAITDRYITKLNEMNVMDMSKSFTPSYVFRKEENQVHSMQGNHIAGVATSATGAQQVEMWCGRMDANSASPPHCHDTEEIVLFLKGSGRATVAGREVRYQSGDTLILPRNQIHQIFSDTESEFVSAMPITSTVTLPDGVVIDLPWRS